MVDWYMPWFTIERQKKDGVSKDHFCNLPLPGCQFFREYLHVNENILGYYSRGQVLSIHAKNQTQKISCYCPFKSPSNVGLFSHDKWAYKTQEF